MNFSKLDASRHASRRTNRVLLVLLCLLSPLALAERVASVEVLGLSDEQHENALRFLTIQGARERDSVPESRIRFLYARGKTEIGTSLEPFGYYSPSIESELEQRADGWHARYTVRRGDPVRVTGLEVVIAGEASDDNMVSDAASGFLPRQSQRLDHRRYEASRQSLLRLLSERGYFDARLLESRIEVDVEKLSAKISVKIDSGQRYRFGEVRFEGSQFEDVTMRRFVHFQPGDEYSQGALLLMQRRMADSEYFNFANVSPVLDDASDGQMPVLVSVSPRPRHLYTAGLVIGTDSGIGVRAGVERRWVNQRGHKARVDVNAAQRRNTLSLGYTIPRFERGVDSFGLNLKDEDTDTSELQSAELIASRLFRYRGWQNMVSIRALRENYVIAGLDDTTTLVYPSWRISRSHSDDELHPRRGYAVGIEARAASDSLLSDVSFTQLRADARYIYGFRDEWRLLLRGEAGATNTSDFERLPVSLRFFAGGDRSVRGYAYQELGPLNEEGLVIGGRYLLATSVEVERMLRGNWGVAVFADAGNAFNDPSDYRVRTGAGIGLRWRSPVGMVRVDVASALDKEGSPLRLHFIIGPEL